MFDERRFAGLRYTERRYADRQLTLEQQVQIKLSNAFDVHISYGGGTFDVAISQATLDSLLASPAVRASLLLGGITIWGLSVYCGFTYVGVLRARG
jgi:hypothetical protein